ncbi:hypothetical protein BGZ65_006194 [Modicella reniformis]|uniref:Late embryogenesis abundant protein LEA-2 subgroup domain-containing protein n=1 Tax=Modicella reniformis TaxID=1440133 RepID=A0A9P6JHA9_9FUNG|nr:hypothetical protein BGZ65_006194 [Modicella reniformis]
MSQYGHQPGTYGQANNNNNNNDLETNAKCELQHSNGYNGYNGYNNGGPPTPPEAENGHKGSSSNSSDSTTRVIPIKAQKPKSRYLPCFPCIRSTYGRVACCLCIVILLVIIILVIVFFAVFKRPTADYLGIRGTPVFSLNQGVTTLGISFIVDLQIKNPNPVGIDVESIVSTVYYPGYGPPIGDGTISHVNFPSKSTTVMQFPMVVNYDRREDPSFLVVRSILTKCGLFGRTDDKINVTYYAKMKIKILSFTFTEELKDQVISFDCPVNTSQWVFLGLLVAFLDERNHVVILNPRYLRQTII